MVSFSSDLYGEDVSLLIPVIDAVVRIQRALHDEFFSRQPTHAGLLVHDFFHDEVYVVQVFQEDRLHLVDRQYPG